MLHKDIQDQFKSQIHNKVKFKYMPCISVPYNKCSMFDLGFDNTEFGVNV